MKRLATIAAAAALLVAPAGARPAEAELFCHDLGRVIEAAGLGGDFAALERGRAAPPRLGFRGGCRAAGGDERHYWVCGQNFAPDEMSRDALAARIAACLPEAERSDGGLWRETIFTLPHAEIRLSESGGPGAHVGRIVELVVEAKDASRSRPSSGADSED